MWVVPTYANPTGSIVTQEVAERLASMATAAPDFKIFWDNAYAFHHLTEDEAKSADILVAGRRPPGTRTGRSCSPRPRRSPTPAPASRSSAGSVETVKWYIGHLGKGAIGPDKVNQLRHAQFFGSPQGVRDHMAQAPRDHRAEVRRRCERSSRAARRPRHRDLDPADRRLLRQPRRAGRHRGAGDRAGQGGRRRADARRARRSPTATTRATATSGWRPTFPEPAEVDGGDGGGRHLRAAGRRGEAAGVTWRDAVRRRSLRELPKAHLHLHFTGLDAARHPARARRARRHPAARRSWSRTGRRSCRRPTRRAGSASSGSTTWPGRCCAPRTTYAGWCCEAAEDDVRDGGGWLEIQVDPSGYAARFGGITAFTDLVLDAVRDASRADRPRRWPWSSPPTAPGTRSTPAPWPGWPAQYAGRGVVGFGLSNDERRGSTADFAPRVPDRRAGRAAAGAARRRAARPRARRGRASTRCTPSGSATASASAEDPALLDRIVAAGSRSRSARSPTWRSASTPT